jgi:hypothetical protein
VTTPVLVFDGEPLDIVIRQGKTFRPRLAYKDPAGVLVVLTGWTAKWVAAAAGTQLFDISSGSGMTLGGTPYNIHGDIAAATTATWPPGKYLHELEVTNPNGVEGFVQGKLTVLPETAK